MINNPIISSEFRTINKPKLPWTPQELKYPGQKIVNKHINTLKAIKFNINKNPLNHYKNEYFQNFWASRKYKYSEPILIPAARIHTNQITKNPL